MADLPSDIDRINALTSNARNTWFVLLGALVFVGITLLDVEHIDFYGVDRATDLPLVSVSVPTRYFFYAAPLLIAAIFGYFHLYLIRLWDAISVAEPQHGGRPLGDVIAPWLVTDAALYLRTRLRGDGSATHRILEGSAMLLNFLLAWAFGLGVLGWLWWASMPARDVWMTGLGAVALSVSLFAGAASFAMMVIRMRERTDGAQVNIFGSTPAMGAVLVAIPVIFILTEQRTMGDTPGMLAPIELLNENIVERPAGWLPHVTAREEYRDAWCARKDKTCADLSENEETALDRDWTTRRAIALRDLRRPDWLRENSSHRPADLRGANLRNAFMSAAYLRGAQMQGANLIEAQMERANLSGAQMEGADLSAAQMEGADLRGAQMEGAVLIQAHMKGALLIQAKMEAADLFGAQMEGTDLFQARMDGADLRRAQMAGAVLKQAQMEGADLGQSRLFGSTDRPSSLTYTNLSASLNDGGALRFVDMTGAIWDEDTDFRNAFLDGSVALPPGFAARMGGDRPRPCQWVENPLSDEDFFAVWRWWFESNGQRYWFGDPPEDLNVPLPTSERLAELGLTDCTWHDTWGPMPDPD